MYQCIATGTFKRLNYAYMNICVGHMPGKKETVTLTAAVSRGEIATSDHRGACSSATCVRECSQRDTSLLCQISSEKC